MIELDMTFAERKYGIGYDVTKSLDAWDEKDEPEITLDQVTGETIEVSNEN